MKGFISELGGCEVSKFHGNFWFKQSGLLLSTGGAAGAASASHVSVLYDILLLRLQLRGPSHGSTFALWFASQPLAIEESATVSQPCCRSALRLCFCR